MIALPGIIDAHTCLWQTVLRGYVPDLWPGAYYSKFLPLRSRFTAEDNFNAAYVGGFEMLSYGTTDQSSTTATTSRRPDYAPASIAALKETGIRHLFTYSFMSVLPDQFARAGGSLRGRPPRLRQVPRSGGSHHHRLRHRVDRRAAGSRKQLAFSRDLEAPSCIHVNETGTIDRLHAGGLLGPDLLRDPRQPDHQWRARADGQGPHAALLHPDRRHAGHAGRRRAPRHRSRRRGRVRLRRPLFHRLRPDRTTARHVQRPGLPRRGDGAELLDGRRTAAARPARIAAADAAQAASRPRPSRRRACWASTTGSAR